MTTYSTSRLNQSLLPRSPTNPNARLISRIEHIPYNEGAELYDNSKKLPTDYVEGPIVRPGDKVILMEQINGITNFWMIWYLQGIPRVEPGGI